MRRGRVSCSRRNPGVTLRPRARGKSRLTALRSRARLGGDDRTRKALFLLDRLKEEGDTTRGLKRACPADDN
jgi:hypothetical protein